MTFSFEDERFAPNTDPWKSAERDRLDHQDRQAKHLAAVHSTPKSVGQVILHAAHASPSEQEVTIPVSATRHIGVRRERV